MCRTSLLSASLVFKNNLLEWTRISIARVVQSGLDVILSKQVVPKLWLNVGVDSKVGAQRDNLVCCCFIAIWLTQVQLALYSCVDATLTKQVSSSQ